MLVTTYVDESGTGGNPRIMLAALAARAHRWHGFRKHWQRLLDAEEIEFSHIVAMENKNPPFENWGLKRTVPFVHRAARRMQKNCDFGFTAALSIEDYKKHYREQLPAKVHKDSSYGLCARGLIESVVTEASACFGENTVINFVFEESQHFEEVRRVFRDLKDHVPEVSRHLGHLKSGAKHEFAGLQAADLLASLGRRSEGDAKFTSITPGTALVSRHHGRLVTFHLMIDEKNLRNFCEQATSISAEKRWNAAKRKRARQRDGSDSDQT